MSFYKKLKSHSNSLIRVLAISMISIVLQLVAGRRADPHPH